MNDAVFYQESIDPGFRFGDVIKGFISATPNVSNPPINFDNTDYSIEISMSYCAIVSPCCSIKDKVISLSPLLQVNKNIFKNPYFREDLTRINQIVPPEKSVPPIAFKRMPTEKKEEILSKDPSYAFTNLFIYNEHDLFPDYPIRLNGADDFNTRYYVIDFRNTFRVICSKIQNPTNVPPGLKCLQLTIDTRNVLRDKITYYYGRPPAEDIVD
jgi:hypothetical protein